MKEVWEGAGDGGERRWGRGEDVMGERRWGREGEMGLKSRPFGWVLNPLSLSWGLIGFRLLPIYL